MHDKLRKIKSGHSPGCRKRLSLLPDHFKPKRRGVLTEEQLELVYVEYWKKGYVTAQQIRERLKEREDDVPFEAIQRKFAAWRGVEAKLGKTKKV